MTSVPRNDSTSPALPPLSRPDPSDTRTLLLATDTTVIDAAASLATDLGYEREDLLGRRLSALLPAEDLRRVGTVLVALVDGTVASVTAPQRLLHGSGAWLDVALTARLRHAGADQATGAAPAAIGFELQVGPLNAPADRLFSDLLPVPFQYGSIAAAVVDTEGRLCGANRAWGDLFGAAGSTDGNHFVDHTLDGVGPELAQELAALGAGRRHGLRQDLRADGAAGIFWCRLSASRLASEPIRLLLTAEDVTQERLQQRILAANETLFRSVAETSPVGMARVTDDLVLTYANPSWLHVMCGANVARAPSLESLLHPEDAEVLRQAREGGFVDQVRARLAVVTPDAEASIDDERWVSLRFAPLSNSASPDPIARHGWVVTVEEVTDLVQRHQAASRLAAIVERTTDLVGIVDLPTRRVVYLNNAAAVLLGDRAAAALEAGELESLVPDLEHSRYRVEILPKLAAGEVWSGEVQVHAGDDSTRTLLVNLAPDLDRNGIVSRISGLGRDITAQRQTEDDLAYRATHDALTGLPNRSLLFDHLTMALARAARESLPVAILFCDLDRFKAVNDTYGHEAGDELLREVAERLRAAVRPSDTVARLAGDEFVVVCEQIESEIEALSIADRITRTIAEPFSLAAGQAEVTASLGVALSEPGDATADLLQEADSAMYRAKRAGRARAELFDDDLRARNEERQTLSRQLRDAIERAELELHYQPIFTLGSGRVEAAETLVRWRHPTRGLLGAADILGVASDTGLMLALDEAVLAAACRQGRVWFDLLGAASPILHVNLSNRSLTRRDLPAIIAAIIHDTGLPARNICLELSGSAAGVDHGDVDAQLVRLDELGVQLAIDDFGQLPTQLGRLRTLPIDLVKLDPSITAAVNAEPAGAQVVAGIIALAHALGLRVIAEGVESPEVADRLRELGCDAAQGHTYGMPGPSTDAASWLPTA